MFVKSIIKGISELKSEAITPDAFSKILDSEQDFLENHAESLKKSEFSKRKKDLDKQFELLRLYQAYQDMLQERKRYDFEDMIVLVGQAFTEDQDLLFEYQEELQYFLVDEYQDTNQAQSQVVESLASHWGEQANLFVVGDPNQAIYRFQGASVENVLEFADKYPQAKVITLHQGYRCPQQIYNAASGIIAFNHLNSLVKSNFPDFNQPLKSHQKLNQAITISVSANETIEVWSIVGKVESLLANGVKPHQIAILYRANKDAQAFQLALSSKNIRYDIEAGDDVLKNERIRQFLELLKLINQLRPTADKALQSATLFEVLSYDWIEIDNLVVYELCYLAHTQKKSFLEILSESSLDQELVVKLQPVQTFINLLMQLSQLDYNTTFPEWFVEVLDQTGYRAWVMSQPDKVEHLINLQSLFAQVKEFSSAQHDFKLENFLNAIALMESHQIILSAEDFSMGEEAVRLATVHKAKGGEWQYVFMVHCVDKKWGNVGSTRKITLPEGLLKKTQLDIKERNEDERRLFYVALTRASRQVIISYAQSKASGTRTVANIPSMFIQELKSLAENQKLNSEDSQNPLTDPILEVAVKPPAEEIINQLESNLKPIRCNIFDQNLRNKSESKTNIFAKSASDSFSQQSLDAYRAFFFKVLENFSLSVTALNAYLSDPVKFVNTKLLRIPMAKVSYLAFGTAIHSALEHGFKNHKHIDLDAVLIQFEKTLSREILTASDYQRWLLRGREVLQNYFQHYNSDLAMPFLLEKAFGYGQSKTMLADIHLSGRIDRIDWIDPLQNTVKVIDYKTGTDASVNEIEGLVPSMNLSEREKNLPEAIRGPLKRQLLFYKLLTELDDSFKPTVTHGVFEFVEPKDSGNLVTRVFELHQEDVDLLKQLIIQVMSEVRSLKFLDEEL
jgi:DNA helicase II / ATP-dependent DNA helicase PcrA